MNGEIDEKEAAIRAKYQKAIKEKVEKQVQVFYIVNMLQ